MNVTPSISLAVIAAAAAVVVATPPPLPAAAAAGPRAPVAAPATPRSIPLVYPEARTGEAVVGDTVATLLGAYKTYSAGTASFVLSEEGRPEHVVVGTGSVPPGSGTFSAVVTGLRPSSTYQYRAVVESGTGTTVTGTLGMFRTNGSPDDARATFPAPSPFVADPPVVPKPPVYGQGMIRVVERRLQINSYLLRAKVATPTCSSAAKVTLRARSLRRPVVRTTRMVTGGAGQCAIPEVKIPLSRALRAARKIRITISGRDVQTFRTTRPTLPESGR